MTNELQKINDKYNDEKLYPLFPFISKNKIHILGKGLYRKNKAKFRGVTAKYDDETGSYVFPLYGMYYLPEDIVIVPNGFKESCTPERLTFYQAAIKAGYKEVNKPPAFKTVYFPEDSPEAKAALANRSIYHQSSNPLQEGDLDI